MERIRISPVGAYELGVAEEDDRPVACRITLPDERAGYAVELDFTLAAFVTFADWIADIAGQLVDETKDGAPPPG